MVRIFHVSVPGRTVLLATTEAVLVVLALCTALFSQFGADTRIALTYGASIARVLVAAAVCMFCMHLYDLYFSSVLQNIPAILTRLVQVLGAACVVLPLLSYIVPGAWLGRDVVLTWIGLTALYLAVWRVGFHVVNNSSSLRSRAVFVGVDRVATALANEMRARPELGFSIVGYVDDDTTGSQLPFDHLGTVSELPAVIERHGINCVIVANAVARQIVPDGPRLSNQYRGIVQTAEEIYEAVLNRVPIANAPDRNPFPNGVRLSTPVMLSKRLFSLAVSFGGLVICSPLMCVIAIAIKMDSTGPVIFRQRRIGKAGRVFTLYKFRSMVANSDDRPANRGDVRFTSVGHIIRRTRLDELPQLYNILKGDMSLVGPRPFAEAMEQDLARRIPFYRYRWSVPPGITGWAQTQRGYCVSLEDNIEKLSYDLFYIKHMSVGLDLLICFETVKILLIGRGSQ